MPQFGLQTILLECRGMQFHHRAMRYELTMQQSLCRQNLQFILPPLLSSFQENAGDLLGVVHLPLPNVAAIKGPIVYMMVTLVAREHRAPVVLPVTMLRVHLELDAIGHGESNK
jgi:hypothetical protein